MVLGLAFAVVAPIFGWQLQRTEQWDKPRWPAAGVTVLVIVVTVAGTAWLMSERVAAEADQQWRSQQDDETQAFHPRCGGADLGDDSVAPGSNHYPG